MIMIKRIVQQILIGILFVSTIGFQSPSIWGQQALEPEQSSVLINPEQGAASKTLTTLRGIIEAQNVIRMRIREKEEALQAAVTEDEKTGLSQEIVGLRTRLSVLDGNFESIATGVDLDAFAQKSKTEFDWKEELQEILGPIIEELKNMTARPREIERLRNDVAAYEKQLVAINDALDNLLLLKQYVTTQELEQALSPIETAWIEKEKEVSNRLEIAKYRLAEKLDTEKPITDTIQELVREFFSSRGRNLVLAILAFVSVLLCLRYLYKYFTKISPFHEGQKRTFYGRLIEVLYNVFTVLGATIALIVVLYVVADWVLLGIVIILLLGIVWAARQWFPMVWEQVKLLLNVSTVREHERVVYNGLPWRVVSLNLYTRFHNPALKGGLIRLPLRDLVGLQSRPFYKDEPWFPCQEDDWVVLDDDTFGKVVMQTPEIVQLILLGGSCKTYPTTAFLAQNPTNLSMNFRLTITFGVDYKHQPISTDEIPQQLKARLHTDLASYGYQENLQNLTVEFKEAGASSLDMAILADFTGDVAQDYLKLERLLQRISVDACNEHGWEIPFTQVTVHTAQA
jgi:hypothetical protein